MQQLPGHNVLFDPEWFDESTLLTLLGLNSKAATPATPSVPPSPALPANTDARTVHQNAWNQMLKSPKLAAAIKTANKNVEDAYADFQARLNKSPLEPVTVPKYTVTKTADGGFLHQIGGLDVLLIAASPTAEQQSTHAERLAACAAVIGDGILLFLAAVGVKVVMSPSTILRTMTSTLESEGTDAMTVTVEWAERINAAPTREVKLKKLAGLLTALPNAVQFVEKLILNMSWLEIALTVVLILATVSLLLVTAGASATVAIAGVVLATVVLVRDVVKLLQAYDLVKAT